MATTRSPRGSVLPLPPIPTLDDLIDTARRGAAARSALEYVRDRLAEIRDGAYKRLLSAPAEDLVELRADLRAVERLATALLSDEEQGERAYQQLLTTAPSDPGGDNRP